MDKQIFSNQPHHQANSSTQTQLKQQKSAPTTQSNSKNKLETKQQISKQSIQTNQAQFWQKIFEISTEVGKINLQVISFKTYKWVIITQSNSLVIDGSLQLAMKTPYSDKPTVLDIGADENQADSEEFCSKLSNELGCPVVLSMNLQIAPSIRDQRNIIKFLANALKPKSQHQEQKQEQKEQGNSVSVFAKKQKPSQQEVQITQK